MSFQRTTKINEHKQISLSHTHTHSLAHSLSLNRTGTHLKKDQINWTQQSIRRIWKKSIEKMVWGNPYRPMLTVKLNDSKLQYTRYTHTRIIETKNRNPLFTHISICNENKPTEFSSNWILLLWKMTYSILFRLTLTVLVLFLIFFLFFFNSTFSFFLLVWFCARLTLPLYSFFFFLSSSFFWSRFSTAISLLKFAVRFGEIKKKIRTKRKCCEMVSSIYDVDAKFLCTNFDV